MPTFVTLVEFTADLREERLAKAGERYEGSVELVESYGGEVKGVYYGDIAGYDAMTITEYPDRESHDKALLEYDMSPNVKTDSFEVRTPEEHFELVDDVVGD